MSTLRKVKEISESTARNLISALREDEKKLVLVWSEKVLAIRNDRSLPSSEKIKRLNELETPKVVKSIAMRMFEIFKNKLWTNQSWARRLGFGGLALGAFTFGGTGVGIATLGAGIGLPLMVLTAGGGVILGSVIDEIKKDL